MFNPQIHEIKPNIRDIGSLVLISAITGLLLALPVGAVSAVLKYAHPVQLAFIVWLILQALTWLTLLARWSKLLNLIELALQVDISGDGKIAGEEPGPVSLEPVRVEIIQDAGRHVEMLDLPVSLEQLTALAAALMAGASLSESSWTGAGAPFSKSEFIRLRDELIKRNLARWRNERAPAQGLMLTPGGKACMRHFAAMSKQERLS